jgi:hypothetical protein
MNDPSSMVRHYVSQFATSDAEDACHSLLELGPVALPHVHEAFRLTHNGVVKVRPRAGRLPQSFNRRVAFSERTTR